MNNIFKIISFIILLISIPVCSFVLCMVFPMVVLLFAIIGVLLGTIVVALMILGYSTDIPF